MNVAKKPKPAPDPRLLVLLVLGLALCLPRLLATNLFLEDHGQEPPQAPPLYGWLAAEGLTEGLYRIDPALLTQPEKASRYGLDGQIFLTEPDFSVIAALRLNGDQPATILETPPGLAPFFFAPIAVNRADRELLMTLPGIGPALADAIIALRQEKEKLNEPHELLEIRGIGKVRLANLTERLVFD
jgi:hypothetical protein